MYIITQSLCCTSEITQPRKSAIPQFLKINPSGQFMASLIAQLVKNLPAMQETLARFLGQEDPLEKGSVTHSSSLGLTWWLSLAAE